MMNRRQIERIYRRLWERMTRGDGYQPWGYDEPTLRMIHPGFFDARDRLRQLWERAVP